MSIDLIKSNVERLRDPFVLVDNNSCIYSSIGAKLHAYMSPVIK